jgi:hypothetical protein
VSIYPSGTDSFEDSNEERSDSALEAWERSDSIELSDWGDEDDLSDEEDHPLVALLESDCSLKNEVEVGASDSSMVGVLICAFLRLFPLAMVDRGPRRGVTGVSSLVGRQLDRVWTILPDLLA